MGYILYRISSTTVKWRLNYIIPYWLMVCGIFQIATTMTYFRSEMPIWLSSGIQSFGKLALGYYIGSIVIVCQQGYGGYFARALNSNMAQHLSKLSFVMYMVSPVWITLIYGLKRNGNYFDEIETIMGGITTWLFSYISAILVVPIAELPFVRLSDHYILKK